MGFSCRKAFYWPVWSFAVVFVILSQRCHGSCSEKELETREEEANVVLTGTVEEILNMDPVHNTYSCKVRVWRYLKGKTMVNGEVLLDGGNKVMIGGFGDPHICDNQVATGDTRIFFVNLAPEFMWPNHKNELMLNSSLMRITLRNLEEVEHCVEDKPVHFTPAPPPDGCRGKLCGFGAVCERNPTDPSKGECVCKKIVCTSVVAPVCGSDSSTYSNECELEKAQCNTQRRIKVMRKGPCALKDPCSEVTCSFGSTCIQSSDGLSAKCMCPLSCENVPKHVVCGSDGLDYQSECELHMKACATQKNIRVHHQGRCDPCSDTLNSLSVACRVNPKTYKQFTFAPADSCPPDSTPICASDGHTYYSECQMERTALQNNLELKKVSSGSCKEKRGCPNGCKFNAMCLLENGEFQCSCDPIQCDGTYKPLCGKDGKTYPNDCERKLEECRIETDIPIKQQGPCDLNLESPCLKKTCEFGAVCVVKNSKPVCECSDACPQDQDPVCGSDGHTYSSSCQMKAMGCALQKKIQMQHKGPCADESCNNCSFGAICDAQTGRCVCPKGCLETRQPVCGSDGMTYENECKLNVEACTKQLDLRVVAHGECKTCGSTVCSWGARCVENQCECQQCTGQPVKPVCGNDGNTYNNDCELRLASCKKQRKIEVAKPGVCDEDCGSGGSGSGSETCEQDRCRRYGGSWDDDTEDDRCVCDFTCQTVPHSSVCGSDGNTYTSECELKKARCEKQMDLLLQSQGPCSAIISAPTELVASQHCSKTVYGCCQDNKTAALGFGLAGCPSVCQCNHYGSYGGTCDPSTGQCSCKPGVGGLKCDRCEPGFWNFRGIVTENMSGCTPCNCDGVGSVRDDCEQMSGLCSCKPGVKGMKCNVCPDGSKMGANGCDKGPEAPKSCDELMCHFGASCVEVNGQAHCECPSPDCDEKNKTKVCGSDGVTYADRCQLRTIACRQDKEITVEHLGQCKESIELTAKPTPFPTTHHTTPPTAHVKITKQRHGHTTTTTSSILKDLDSFVVEALPPPKMVEAGKYSSSFTTHRPTTLNKPPRTSSPPLDSSPDFDESGSGEPSGDDEMVSGMEESGEEPLGTTVATTTLPTAEERSSCDNTPFGCCPDGKTAAISSENTNCPSTMRFSGFLHLDKVEGQEVFYTPEMEDPKSELFGETARSIESALNELFRKSDVQKDFQSVRVKNLAPSNSIIAFIEVHFDPDTRFSVEAIEGALLKQLKVSKDTGIVVKKPEEENIRITTYGLSAVPFFTTTTTTVASVTTPTTTSLSPTSAFTTLRPTTTRWPFTSRRTTTDAPATTTPSKAPTTTVSLKNRLAVHGNRPCESQPCRQGGTCVQEDNDFTCICPAGRGGAVCEKVIKYFIPSFGGKSYLAFRTMRAYHTVRIAMEFRASEMTGIFLYNGQKGKKDFLSLALVEGHVELRFNTGSGTSSVISKVLVRPGRWHQLIVVRNRRNAMLSVDNEPSVEGQSPPGTDGLNLDTDLFIGGVLEDMIQDVKERTSVSTGLVGCIRMLDVNNLFYNLQENGDSILYGSGVGECGNNPCMPNPCKNGASCQVKEAEMFHCKCVNGFSGPTCADAHNPCDPNKCHPSSRCQVLPEGGYKCECPMGREGKHCEKVSDKGGAFIPYFTGDSFLELKGLHLYSQDLRQKFSMTVVLLANDSKGMIFYNGQKTDGKGDFISLSLNDGILEFRYDLGKGPAVIRSKEKIKLNEWSTVNLERASRKGEISINGKDPVRGEAPKSRKNQHTDLNLKESLFVGGAPDFRKVARAAAIKDGFKGAIQKITLMGIPILKSDNALHSSDVSMYPYHPCSKDVCKNGGRCNPLLDSYECICRHGFTGQHCQDAIIEKSAGDTEAIAFDGHTFIEYHNGVTKSEKALLVNKFELSIRTEATHGLILWSGKGVERSDYIALAIVDGRVQMTYDLGSKPVVLRSSVRINTNRWIRIKASRALRDGSLQVGNEAAVTGSSPLAATQLDTDGALWLGGLEELSVARRLPKAYSTGFVGCVKDVIVDGVELHLVEDALNSPKIVHCSAK
ncbi:agrin isoform X1 [Sinocyclocheilus grahami]|uniref:agrin isoform X1 n=1 Tax=Sinocyclocheilus grahami TaxID=75366 RepID=UPI0007AD3FFC|nr:PREDICTED: agrin-like isoform X1 [Sinocyclocheilus grahami]XP_016135598.1 PREDICTED: agrin-like isoform X1 [Sinocyclocheilus grahami]